MSEVATFFRHREQDPGETYQLQVKTEKLSYQFSAYSRSPIEIRAHGAEKVVDKKECEAIFKDLRHKVGTLGGGGLIVTTTDNGGRRDLAVTLVSTDSFQPPQHLVVLAPGRPVAFSPLDGKDLDLPAGAHVIVPVDGEAEERLKSFIGHLEWLPRDFESLVLSTLRRPSLDARLARIESRLKLSDPTTPGSRLGRWRQKLGGWTSNPTLRWGAVGLLGLLLIVTAYFVINKVDEENPGGGKKGPSIQEPTPSPSPSPTPRVEATEALSDEIGDLIRGIQDKRSMNPSLGLLYDGHFAGFYQEPLSDEDVKALFRSRYRQEQGPGNRPFLLGLIKLQALKLDPDPPSTQFLEAWDNVTATKSVFKEPRVWERLMEDSEGLSLVSALACRLGYDNPIAPGLPTFSSTPNSPALEFAPGTTCEEYTVDDIEEGLQGLVDFVERL